MVNSTKRNYPVARWWDCGIRRRPYVQAKWHSENVERVQYGLPVSLPARPRGVWILHALYRNSLPLFGSRNAKN